jgi:hypothetical protein
MKEKTLIVEPNLDPNTLFRDYHRFEIRDSLKVYDHDIFNHDFGFGEHTYKWVMIHVRPVLGTNIIFEYPGNPYPVYMVAEEQLEFCEKEILNLSKYCTCVSCSASFFSFTRWFGTSQQSLLLNKCMKTGRCSKKMLNQARLKKRTNELKKPFY